MTNTEKILEVSWQQIPNQIGLTLNIGTQHTYIESKLNDEERKGIKNIIEFAINQAIAEEREREMFIINFMGMDIVARVPDNFRIDKDQTDRILSSAKETINELINAPFKKRTIDEIRADLEND